jgi:RNA-binding protein 39
MLKDKRSGRHKGCAYVELKKLEDVPKALKHTEEIPDFQRFPILIKPSSSTSVSQIDGMGGKGLTLPGTNGGASGLGLVGGTNGMIQPNERVESQKVYVGNIDQNVTQSQLYAIFSQFGQLDRVLLQVDIATGLSKGFAFLSYQDPKVGHLALVVMAGQLLANKPM